MSFDQLIKSLCERLDLGSLEPNSAGKVEIAFDGGVEIALSALDSQHVLIESSLGFPPLDEFQATQHFQQLLQKSLGRMRKSRAVVSFNEANSEGCIFCIERSDSADADDFMECVEAFVNTVEWWQNAAKPALPTTSMFGFVRP